MADLNLDSSYEIITSSPSEVKLSADAHKLLKASMAGETRRSYYSRLRHFSDWCIDSRGIFRLPVSPELFCEYVTYLVNGGYSYVYVRQLCAAMSLLHESNKLPNPTKTELVKQFIKGVTRTLGVDAKNKKAAITKEVLRKLLCSVDRKNLTGARDAALILVGFAGAFRRSELAALNIEDLSFVTAKSGLPAVIIHIKHSKTDQTGKGMDKAIFTAEENVLCPVEALNVWLDILSEQGICEGALFRKVYKGKKHVSDERINGDTVDYIIKKIARNAGISYLDLSAHSLRSGFITTAIDAGMTERSIQNQTGHKSLMILRGYYRRDSALTDNAADGIL